MNHSPELWAVFEGDKIVPASYKRTGFTVIAQCYLSTGTNLDGHIKANAERIAACVNACKGIEIGQLKPGLLKALEQDTAELVVFMGTVRDRLYNAESMTMDERRDLAKQIEVRLP